MKKKKSKIAAVKSAWPIAVVFLIVGTVVGYVYYTIMIDEQKKVSQDSVRLLATSAFVISESKMAVFPDSLGDLVSDKYVTPDKLLSPWSETTLPENFDRLPEPEQMDWVNRHSDYVYLPSGRRVRENNEIIVFELAPQGRFSDVAIATYADIESDQPFADRGAARRVPFDEADELIKAQTGYSIQEWHDAELPGAGLMTGEFVPRPASEHHIPRP